MLHTTIKKATITDLILIQKISKETFIETFAAVNTAENLENYLEESFNSQKLTAEINNPDSQFYLVFFDTQIIGYLKINLGNAQTETGNDTAMEIHRIYVLRSFHGKKIGQLLLNEAISIAKQNHVDYLWLGVWEENYTALKFYSKNGFVAFDKHVFTLGNDQQTDLLLKLEIPKAT